MLYTTINSLSPFLRRTQEVTIINFALGKHLVREDDLLTDQRGSLAYVSPDVISGKHIHTRLAIPTHQ